MTTLEQSFNEWAARVLPDDTTPTERLHAQLCFYAGGMAVMAAQGPMALEATAFMNLYRSRYTALTGEPG